VLKINAFRGIESFEGDVALIRDAIWSHLFHNFNDKGTITIDGELGIGKHINLSIKQTTEIDTHFHLGDHLKISCLWIIVAYQTKHWNSNIKMHLKKFILQDYRLITQVFIQSSLLLNYCFQEYFYQLVDDLLYKKLLLDMGN